MGCEAPNIVERYTGSDPFVREMGNALRGEFRSSQIPSTEYLECWAGVIAIHLANAYGNRRLASSHMLGLPHNKLAKVLGFIEKHLGDTIQVEDLARTIFMSPFHFARMFKLAVGQSPHAYITCQRMQRAKDLLCNSELPLVDVAGNLGFQTQAHFTGVFRRHVGSTPRAYRLGNRASPGASSFADVQVARNGALI
jgi:AraC family transcriptional regulator